MSLVNTGKTQSESTRAKMSLVNTGENNPMFGKTHSEETRVKMRLATTGVNNPNFGKTHSEETRAKMTLAKTGKTQSESTRAKISLANSGKTRSEETRVKMRLATTGENNPNFGKTGENAPMFGKTHSEETRVKMRLAKSDVWYGGVTYNERKYCELWTENLKMRIRSFYGDVSVLSGKTKTDNKNRNLSCHHVYYQKKACCEWDEDVQGYYAMIDGEKYYIKGDPNKFVTLTAGENTMVEKDKLKWVKIFEDIIENKYYEKCYFTKDEYEIIRS